MSKNVQSDEIVVSGIAGRFPEADDIEELWSKLMNGIELSSTDDRRWPLDVFDLPKRSGKIKHIEKFDADFFGVNEYDANCMDPQIRLLHETTWEAIFDAGINPEALRGTKTSVYIGACFSDTALALTEKNVDVVSFCQAMASRVSFAFDFRGPAFLVDTACASGFSAFLEGCTTLRKGLCDQLIVAGLSVTLNPAISFGFRNIKMIAPDGRSKCLDRDVNGYCRSETVVSLFLQKRNEAKRVYASVMHGKTNTDGYKQEGITYPKSEAQRRLMTETIAECGLQPLDVNYVEAHMTGTAAGDPAESKAIIGSYRPNDSEKPLNFGCLKSNLGHTEGASGCIAITKVCLAFQQRSLPPNINFKNPNPNIEALSKGIIVPVLKATSFDEEIVPVNSFGFGGVNVHVILKANEKSVKDQPTQLTENDGIPRLIMTSGRIIETIHRIFDWIESNKSKVTREFLALLNDTSKTSPASGLNARGFMIVNEKCQAIEKRVIEIRTKRPLIVLFTAKAIRKNNGLNELMKIKTFDQSMDTSLEVLRTLGVDLSSILDADLEFESFVDLIVYTIVVHIAIADTLKYLKLKVDRVVGESIAKISADYYDGCLTAREAILSGYAIGKCLDRLHNESKNMNGDRWKFLQQFVSFDGFGQSAVNELSNIINSSKKPHEHYLNDDIDHCLIENYVKVIKNGFKFVRKEDEFVVEINNDSLLGVGTDQSQHVNGLIAFLSALGTIYNNGHNMDIEKLYPKVDYPVSRETASLSHLWQWDHSKDWLVTKYPDYFCSMKLSKKVTIDLSDPMWKSVDGHTIDKRLLFPATGYLYLIWGTLASSIDNFDHMISFSIEFRNIKFRRAIMLPKIGTIHLTIHFIPETGEFEIKEGGTLCVSGFASLYPADYDEEQNEIQEPEDDDSVVTLNSKEIYRELRTRGYDYGANFRCLVEAKSDGSRGKLKWNKSWINFTDSVLQLSILEQTERCLYIPTSIDYLKVNASKLRKVIDGLKSSPDQLIEATNINRNYSVANGAMIIKHIIGTPTARRVASDQMPDLEEIRFSPFVENVVLSKVKAKKVNRYITMCSETIEKLKRIKTSKYEENGETTIKEYIENSSDDPTLLKMLYDALTEKAHFNNGLMEKYKFEVAKDLLLNISKQELFRSQIDLAFENMNAKSVNIIECNLTSNFLFDTLCDCLDKNGLTSNYKLLHRSDNDTSSLPRDAPVLWQNTDCLPTYATDIDFILFKDWSTSLMVNEKLAEYQFDLSAFIDSCYKSLKPNGFLLLQFRTSITSLEEEILQLQGLDVPKLFTLKQLRNLLNQTDFSLIGEKIDQLSNVTLLLRKTCKDQKIENQTVIECKTFTYEWIENLKCVAKEKKNDDDKIWLLANDHEFNGVIGMFNCLRKEIGENKLRCILGTNMGLTQEILEKDLKVNVFKNGAWGSLRNFDIDSTEQIRETDCAYLDVQTKGDLSSLKWYESALKMPEREEAKDEIICNIAYAALNFKDVMVSSGKVPLNAYPVSWQKGAAIGMEFSGIDQNHNRICGMCEGGAIASKIVSSKYVWEVPKEWSLEEAATVPVVYLTVYYALLMRGNLKRGETVLIHAGSGGVGQAAISVCLRMNCKVFTTVGTQEKREFLKRKFPQLTDSQIGNSRDIAFEEMIMRETNGRGVDLILNSLAEEKLRASLRCLTDYGRFVEIGKYDIVINSHLEPYLLEKNCAFHVVCVAHLMDEIKQQSEKGKRLFLKLHQLLAEGMKTGDIQPLERHVFEKENYEEAIRFMANGKHIGKVLIKMNDEKNMKNNLFKAIPQTFFYPNKSYIIVGGLGGFGLEVAYWMVSRGANNLILTSRNGLKENYQRFAVKRLESRGAKVVVLKNDATTEFAARKLIEESQRLGPIGGIFILSLVLKDNLIENQSVEDFREVCACKLMPTSHLDSLTRKMNLNIDYFVCFSSLVASLGNRTQSNYGFANAAVDRVCEKRRQDGLHGLSIQWGLIGDVGFVAERFEDKNLVLRGSIPQRMPSCLLTLDQLMQTSYPVCLSMVRIKERNKAMGKDDLKKQICHVLGIKNPDKVNVDSTLGELGLDSLMAVEIRQTLERDYDMELSIMEIRNLSLKQLMEIDKRKSSQAGDQMSKMSEKQENTIWQRLLTIPKEQFVKLNNAAEGLPLFFVPPVDGSFNLMLPLAAVNRPVIGVNWIPEMDSMSTLEEVAEFCANAISKTYPQHEYEILGYSFGAVLGLEICVQLQAKLGQAIVKKALLLDGSAAMLKAQIEDIYSKSNDGKDDAELFWDYLGFNLKFQNEERLKVRDELRSLITKEQKCEKLIQIFNTATGKECDPSLLTSFIERYANKSRLLYKFNPSRKFIGSVKLIRAKEKSLVYNFKELESENYGLSKDVDGEVSVVTLQGYHETLIGENVKSILNIIEEELSFFHV